MADKTIMTILSRLESISIHGIEWPAAEAKYPECSAAFDRDVSILYDSATLLDSGLGLFSCVSYMEGGVCMTTYYIFRIPERAWQAMTTLPTPGLEL